MNMKENIMMRVQTIYLIRRFGIAFLFGALSILCLILIDVPSVVVNVLSVINSSGSAVGFFNSAFSETFLVVKLILIAELIVGFLITKEAIFAILSQRKTLPL